jgi:hypothetical protein
MQRRIPGLRVVTRRLTGRDLSPAADSLRNHFHENNPAVVGNAEAGLKRRLQPQLNLTKGIDSIFIRLQQIGPLIVELESNGCAAVGNVR